MYHLSRLPILLREEVAAMISMEGFMDIIALHRQGMSLRAIARKLGVHRDTVKMSISFEK